MPNELDQKLFDNAHDYRIVTDLLKKGANPNFCDIDGKTVLMKAVSLRRWIPVQTLISAGADVKAKDKYNRNILHYAVDSISDGSDCSVCDLIEHFLLMDLTLFNNVDNNGFTPLDFACRQPDQSGAATMFYVFLKSDSPDRYRILEMYESRISVEMFNCLLMEKYKLMSHDCKHPFIQELISINEKWQPNTPLSMFLHHAKIGDQFLVLQWKQRFDELEFSELKCFLNQYKWERSSLLSKETPNKNPKSKL